MKYLSSAHIIEFARGQTIRTIDPRFDTSGSFRIWFANGESLLIYPYVEASGNVIIATPFRSDGEIKQPAEIANGEKMPMVLETDEIRHLLSDPVVRQSLAGYHSAEESKAAAMDGYATCANQHRARSSIFARLAQEAQAKIDCGS